MINDTIELLEGAWDVHMHAGPDVVPRIQMADEVLADAAAAGMAAIGLKDHCGSTAALAAVLQSQFPEGPRVFGSVTLNPPVGGLNPHAVEAAVREGARTVWFPTYSSKRHLEIAGPGPFPMPASFSGITIWRDEEKLRLKDEVHEILDVIAAHDVILATGHLHPLESIALFDEAASRGIKRMVLTHATLGVTAMPMDLQQKAVKLGVLIEHCMLAMTSGEPECTADRMVHEIRAVGIENIILTSDLGQIPNGPVVAGFAFGLMKLASAGLDYRSIRRMIRDNPAGLFSGF
jgi:hypothetical protein